MGGVSDYPLHEFSEAEKIHDTNAIQNLIWSIGRGMIVAIRLNFGNRENWDYEIPIFWILWSKNIQVYKMDGTSHYFLRRFSGNQGVWT